MEGCCEQEKGPGNRIQRYPDRHMALLGAWFDVVLALPNGTKPKPHFDEA